MSHKKAAARTGTITCFAQILELIGSTRQSSLWVSHEFADRCSVTVFIFSDPSLGLWDPQAGLHGLPTWYLHAATCMEWQDLSHGLSVCTLDTGKSLGSHTTSPLLLSNHRSCHKGLAPTQVQRQGT